MSDAELMKLYSTRILALAADIPHLGRLESPQASSRKRSPLCGSSVTVHLSLQDGRVTAFAQDVKACALGQAAAALLGAVVIGCRAADLRGATLAHPTLCESINNLFMTEPETLDGQTEDGQTEEA